MNEETTSSSPENTNTTATTANTTEHCFLEVGTDVLDKTNALTGILEANGGIPTLIFCNSKSDQEFVEVILKKRGMDVQRISMDISPSQRRDISKMLKDYSFTNLIVNDHFATDFSYMHKGVVVNYSIPEEPEVYLDRIGRHGSEIVPSRIISLVSALDFGNFHYIKKIVDSEFIKLEPPSKEQVLESKLNALVTQAKRDDFKADSTIETLATMLEKHADQKQVLALLLHNTLNVLPSLKNQSSSDDRRSSARGSRREDRDDYRSNDRDSDRGSDRSSTRGEGDRFADRNGGRDRRASGRGRRSDSRGGDSRGSEFLEGSDRNRDRDSSQRGSSHSSFEEGSSEQPWSEGDRPTNGRRERFSLQPPVRDARFYVGHGTREGFSQPELERLVQEKAGITADKLKRVSVRDCYSFIDVAEDQSSTLQSALEGADLSSGKKLFIRKAALINVPRENIAESVSENLSDNNNADNSSEAFSSDESSNNGHSDSNITESAAESL